VVSNKIADTLIGVSRSDSSIPVRAACINVSSGYQLWHHGTIWCH